MQRIHTPTNSRRPIGRLGGLALLLVATIAAPACDEAQAADDDSLADRIAALESKDDIRGIIHAFSRIVDAADPSALAALEPALHADFVLDAIDFDGKKLHFEGLDGVIKGFGPILLAADANLMVSAIDVHLDGDAAQASFKFANSVKPPPQLELDVGVKVLLFAANEASFVREGGAWKLRSLELVHSLAYPGAIADLKP